MTRDMNSTTSTIHTSGSSIKSLSSSGGATDLFMSGGGLDGGPRVTQDFAQHLNSLSQEEKKKVISSLLELTDDDTLSLFSGRLEAEKKRRKKSKDSNKNTKRQTSTGSGSLGELTAVSTPGISELQPSPTASSKMTGFAGFLRSKREKSKKNLNNDSKHDKKDSNGSSQKQNGSSNSTSDHNPDNNSSLESTNRASDNVSSGNNDVKVDEEGYVIREPSTYPPSVSKKDVDKFYSESDSDSDGDDHKKPIHVFIKPIVNNDRSSSRGTGSIAELKQTVAGLSISPSIFHNNHGNNNIRPDDVQMRLKRRQAAMAGGGLGASSEEGPLKRSFSQNVYRQDPESSLFSNSASNISTAGPSFKHSSQMNNHHSHLHNSSNGNQHQAVNNSFGGIVPLTSTSGNNAPQSASSTTSGDRYAALSDLFAEVNKSDSTISGTSSGTNATPQTNNSNFNNSYSNLSKSVSSSSVIMGPPVMTALPKPPSKRTQVMSSPSVSQQNSMTRCKSYGSLSSSEFRMTPVSLNSVGSSRGPSPLTIGFSDAIPLAVALQESISARFKGTDESRCQIQMFGSLKIAFPSGIVQALANNPSPPPLTFRVTNSSKVDKLHPNRDILSSQNDVNISGFQAFQASNQQQQDQHSFEVNVAALISTLRRSIEQSPSARYYNLDILKYQLKAAPGAKSCPLQLVTHWKCDTNSTGLKIEYKYNGSALSTLEPLRNIMFTVTIDADVTDVQGKPQPTWNPASKQAVWSFPLMSLSSDDSGLGSLRAKFDVRNGPSRPSPVSVTFSCVDATLSGLEFDMTSAGYRLSLVKKQVLSGRYTSEADCAISYAGV